MSMLCVCVCVYACVCVCVCVCLGDGHVLFLNFERYEAR